MKKNFLIIFSYLLSIFFTIFLFLIIFKTNAYAEATFETNKNLENANDTRAYRGITFNADGTEVYIVLSKTQNSADSSTDDIFSFSLSTAWDISSTTLPPTEMAIRTKCDRSNKLSQPGGVRFNNDGTKIFISNQTNTSAGNDVCQFNLSTAYDISTLTEYNSGAENDNGFEVNSDNTDVGDSSDRCMGIAFNTDGTKVFCTTNTDKIFEFALADPFNTSDVDSSPSYSNKSFDPTNDGLDDPTGIQFSSSGKEMFVVERDDEQVHQWSLSAAFDLDSTITYRGNLDMTSDYESISGIGTTNGNAQNLEFSSDGSKLYVTFSRWVNNNTTWEQILQYSLDCPYGVVYCESPVSGSDKVLIEVIEGYSEQASRIMRNNIYSIEHRLEWLRRHRKEDNLTHHNIQFQFSDEMIDSAVKTIPASTKKKIIPEQSPRNWFFWSEGFISVGQTGAITDIFTNKIVIGADKKVSENKMYGYAFQFGRDDVEISDSTASLDTDNYSLAFYGTLPQNKDQFVDGLIGVSALKTDHIRKKNSNILTGERQGNQVFSSIKFNKIYNKKDFNLNPSARIDLGFTELLNFSESGSNDALTYKKHQIPTRMISFGTLLNKPLKLKSGNNFTHNGRLEYIYDFSPSNNTSVSYVTDQNTDYFITINNEAINNYRAGYGFDFSSITGWSVNLNYERYNAGGSGHNDNLYLSTGFVPNRKIQYELALKNTETTSAGLNIVKNINGFNFKLNLDQSIFAENFDQNTTFYIYKEY